GSAHVSTWLETIDEARTSKAVWSAVNQRDNLNSDPFAMEIADLVRAHGGGKLRVGLDRCSHLLALSPEAQGLIVGDGMQDTLHCRRRNTREEIACLARSMAATEGAVAAVEAEARPGLTENDLFATMYGNVIRNGGEFIETRLLASGPRTNPWFHEASDRVIRPGELVALDSDTIGCDGYYSDFSPPFTSAPDRPTGNNQALNQMPGDKVHPTTTIFRPRTPI